MLSKNEIYAIIKNNYIHQLLDIDNAMSILKNKCNNPDYELLEVLNDAMDSNDFNKLPEIDRKYGYKNGGFSNLYNLKEELGIEEYTKLKNSGVI